MPVPACLAARPPFPFSSPPFWAAAAEVRAASAAGRRVLAGRGAGKDGAGAGGRAGRWDRAGLAAGTDKDGWDAGWMPAAPGPALETRDPL